LEGQNIMKSLSQYICVVFSYNQLRSSWKFNYH
jgi:hypothetical protein